MSASKEAHVIVWRTTVPCMYSAHAAAPVEVQCSQITRNSQVITREVEGSAMSAAVNVWPHFFASRHMFFFVGSISLQHPIAAAGRHTESCCVVKSVQLQAVSVCNLEVLPLPPVTKCCLQEMCMYQQASRYHHQLPSQLLACSWQHCHGQ